MPWAKSFLGFQPASTDTKVPAKRSFLLFTLQRTCYTRSVCCPREAVVSCCLPCRRLVTRVACVLSPRSRSIPWHSFSPWHNLSKLSSAHGLPKELFIVVNVVFVVFFLSRRIGRGREGERAFRSCGEFPLVGAVGGWPVESPWGSSSSLTQGGWQDQRLVQPWRQADVAARAVTRRRCSAARWAVRPC